MIAEEIRRQKQAEEIARLDNGERVLAAELATKLQVGNIVLSDHEGQLLGSWIEWCQARSARRCPARPATVASYVLAQHDAGVKAEHILATLTVVEKHHDLHNIANPVRTAIVSTALEQVVNEGRPRSFTKEESRDWWSLPPMIKAAIGRRERERGTYLRRIQNELAQFKKLQPDPAQPVVEHKEQVNG
jgi:hypothetical protein